MQAKKVLLKLLLFLLIALSIQPLATSISMGQNDDPSGITISTGVGNVPSGVTLILDTTQRGLSMPLTIEFGIGVPFTEGRLVLELRDTVDKVIEKTTLWEEKAGDKVHNKYNRSLDLPIGIKLSILVEVEYKPIGEWFEVDTNGFCSSGLRLYIHRTSRWITVEELPFGYFENIELIREIEEEHGIKIRGLTPEQSKGLPQNIKKEIERKQEERYYSRIAPKPKSIEVDSISNPSKRDTVNSTEEKK